MSKQNKKILLIEDDSTQVMLYEIEFKLFGYELLIAQNGKDGIKIALKEKPDLILLDLLLGDINGLEVLKTIKKNKDTKETKILILSNYNKKGLEDECKKLGAISYLTKSDFIPKEIVKIAEKYL